MKNILNITSGGGSKITTLLVPTTSTDEAVVRWDGTLGQSIQNSSVTIDDNGNQKTTNSLTLLTNATNPNGSKTLWVNSADANKLYFGANEVGGGNGNVTGAAGSFDNEIVRFSGTTGKVIKNLDIRLETIGGNSDLIMVREPITIPSGDSNTYFGKWVLRRGNANTSFNSAFSSNIMSTGTIDASLFINNNVFLGNNVCQDSSVTGGSFTGNTIIGDRAGQGINATTTGCLDNTLIGTEAGGLLRDDASYNIMINNQGVLGDNNTIRIGNDTDQNIIRSIISK